MRLQLEGGLGVQLELESKVVRVLCSIFLFLRLFAIWHCQLLLVDDR